RGWYRTRRTIAMARAFGPSRALSTTFETNRPNRAVGPWSGRAGRDAPGSRSTRIGRLTATTPPPGMLAPADGPPDAEIARWRWVLSRPVVGSKVGFA